MDRALFGLLAMVIFGLASMMVLLIRQLVQVKKRIPSIYLDAEGALAVGATVPLRTFDTYDNIRISTPFSSSSDARTYLLFASFTCGICRPVLAGLSSLPKGALQNFVIFILDSGIQERFLGEIAELRLGAIPIVEAPALASTFKVTKTPYLYIIDAEGAIVVRAPIFSSADLVKLTQQENAEARVSALD